MEHRDTAEALVGLALHYRDSGDLSNAMPLQQRALAIREKILGPDDVATAATVDGLATLHHASGALDKAEPLYVRALSTRERLQPGHADLADTLIHLVMLYGQTATLRHFRT